MHFLNWVLEKQEEPGDLGLFATVIYQDINNGCALRFTEPSEWKAHFTLKHRKMGYILIGLLENATLEYQVAFNPDKE